MRILLILLTLTCTLLATVNPAQAQTDTTQQTAKKTPTHRDSVYLAKLNSSGNLMLAGGVGLMAAGGYLIYQGYTVYTSYVPPDGSAQSRATQQQNRKQGTAYLVAAGVGIAGGAVLLGLGVRNKIDFKRRKKRLEANMGILPSGQIGFALGF